MTQRSISWVYFRTRRWLRRFHWSPLILDYPNITQSPPPHITLSESVKQKKASPWILKLTAFRMLLVEAALFYALNIKYRRAVIHNVHFFCLFVLIDRLSYFNYISLLVTYVIVTRKEIPYLILLLNRRSELAQSYIAQLQNLPFISDTLLGIEK